QFGMGRRHTPQSVGDRGLPDVDAHLDGCLLGSLAGGLVACILAGQSIYGQFLILAVRGGHERVPAVLMLTSMTRRQIPAAGRLRTGRSPTGAVSTLRPRRSRGEAGSIGLADATDQSRCCPAGIRSPRRRRRSAHARPCLHAAPVPDTVLKAERLTRRDGPPWCSGRRAVRDVADGSVDPPRTPGALRTMQLSVGPPRRAGAHRAGSVGAAPSETWRMDPLTLREPLETFAR